MSIYRTCAPRAALHVRDASFDERDTVIRSFARQLGVEAELVVCDTGPRSSAFFGQLSDKRVRYFHLTDEHMTLGEKRNLCVRASAFELVACFDDDNVYAERYLSTMLEFPQNTHRPPKLSL